MTSRARAAVIINPISGTGRRVDTGRVRAERAVELLSRRGIAADVFVTERPGHARELAAAAVARGVRSVVAWGGDGTVNEVASALAFKDAALAIVPSGSGNGLARELGIPRDPVRAFEIAVDGRDRVMDAGEIDGRLFFNIAGVGLDAQVAHAFAEYGHKRRGFLRYLDITARELFAYQPEEWVIVADGKTVRARVLMVAIANGRQYGNGAIIAPDAKIDDGKLDVVVVDYRPPIQTLLQVPWLFMGRIARSSGVRVLQAATVQMRARSLLRFQIDGEPCEGGPTLTATSRPQALVVKVAVDRMP